MKLLTAKIKNRVIIQGELMFMKRVIFSAKFKKIEHPESYISERLEGDQYKKLAYVRKQRPDAYACLVEATRNLI